jgi:DnaJ-class molecular chaperone
MDDLVYTATITLSDALCARPLTLETLDGRTIKVPIEQIVTPKTVKVVKNEGMPKFNFDDEAELEKV